MSMRIVGGSLKGRRLRSKRGAGLRPTPEKVRSAIFSLIGPAAAGARVLDLYAGTGALGIEAISRGASSASFVEAHAGSCRDIRESLREMGVDGQCRVHCGRVERVLDRLEGGYGLVLADPPYDLEPWEMIMDRLEKGRLLDPGGLVVAEHSRRRRLAESYGSLALVKTRDYGDTSVSVYRSGEVDG